MAAIRRIEQAAWAIDQITQFAHLDHQDDLKARRCRLKLAEHEVNVDLT